MYEKRIEVENRLCGPVKPVNGVGQPPMRGLDTSLFHYLTEAGIPFSRLHDVGGYLGGSLFVDIPNIFRCFDSDPEDPSSYDFGFTDVLISGLVEAGVEPFFRLGVTIENYCTVKAYTIYPPSDSLKWARICEGIIRHYTEGWANGHRLEISHWEIWNEPDSRIAPEENEMWRGTFADYCRLYEVASKHLKAAFPHLKIGGYAGCGVGMAFWKDYSERGEHHLKCFHEFLRFVRERGCPLDFLSFHSYSGVDELAQQIGYVREHLDKAGLVGVETCLDEWLPKPRHDKLGTAQQAAEIAAALLLFQNGPLDSAAIYDARCGLGDYSPLFNPLTYQPHKAYWAFVAFNELRKRGTAVKIRECGAPRSPSRHDEGRAVYAAAARDKGGSLALMLANPSGEEVPFVLGDAEDSEWTMAGECRITDEKRTWEAVPLPDALPPHSFLVAFFQDNWIRRRLVAVASAVGMKYH
ncbi:MAG: hypothetical protein J5921_04215 [Clostridia bacterium]|nr:hypothetical protein [Clostridia bacterium]